MTVLLLGSGLLRQVISTALGEQDDDAATLVITASDAWNTDGHADARRLAEMQAVPWMPVHIELGVAVTGPAERPGQPGCVECARRRRSVTPADAADRAAVRQRHETELSQRRSPALTALAAQVVGSLVAEEAAQLVTEPERARTCGAVVLLDLDQLTVTRHPFLPVPDCSVCGDLPDDSRELAELATRFRVQRKTDPRTYRTATLDDRLGELKDRYVDPETGLLRDIERSSTGGTVVAAAALPRENQSTVWGVGRGDSFSRSELVAILEALERHGGTPRGKRHHVRGSFAALSPDALDPRRLGVHAPESYRDPDFPYRPFDDTDELSWCWGYSFARQAPILVPEPIAYYSAPRRPGDPRHIYENSNGCALGGCLEEAIIHGLLEVAERDAFLMTWHARLPAPRIDLRAYDDPQIQYMVANLSSLGYELLAFDVTMEHGVPCVWAQAVRISPEDRGIKTLCAAGSHLQLAQAVRNALTEVTTIVASRPERTPESARRAADMIADPFLVRAMDDHSVLYGADEAFSRFDFLLNASQGHTNRKPEDDSFTSHDLTQDLHELTRRYLSAGQDVIVVDQTGPEIGASGLACVKVMVPGLLPMTFGHRNRRLHGLPRLRTVPMLLGHRRDPLPEVNPHPHPFP